MPAGDGEHLWNKTYCMRESAYTCIFVLILQNLLEPVGGLRKIRKCRLLCLCMDLAQSKSFILKAINTNG